MAVPDRSEPTLGWIVRGRQAVRRTYDDPNLRGQPKVAGCFYVVKSVLASWL
jgi:hypothetical protein